MCKGTIFLNVNLNEMKIYICSVLNYKFAPSNLLFHFLQIKFEIIQLESFYGNFHTWIQAVLDIVSNTSYNGFLCKLPEQIDLKPMPKSLRH